MEMLDLSGMRPPSLNVHHMLDCHPTQPIAPNEEMLKKLKTGKRSKFGVNQTAHSKKNQSFITGMDPHRLSTDEQRARRAYMEEYNDRMKEDWREHEN